MRTRNVSILWLALCACAPTALMGCDGKQEQSPARLEQASTASCQPLSSNVCGGPWQYTDRNASCNIQDPSCGVASYPQLPNTCWYPTAFNNSNTNPAMSSHQTCTPRCTQWGTDGHGHKVCEVWGETCSKVCDGTATECTQMANNAVASDQAYYSQYYPPSANTIFLITHSTNLTACTCNIVIANIPTLTYQANAQMCGTYDDTANPVYKSCTVNDPKKCGDQATPTYSKAGLMWSQVTQQDSLADPAKAYTCLTCDDVAADTDVQAKYTCLTQRLTWLDSNPSGVDVIALRIQLNDRLARLLEEKPTLLAAPQQQTAILGRTAILDVLAQDPTPACTPDTPGFDLPVVGTSCTLPPELNRLLTLCRQIAALPAAADSTLPLVDACIQLPSRLASLAPGADCQDPYRVAAAKVVSALLKTDLASLQGTDADAPVLTKGLAVIQRWYDTESKLFGATRDRASLWVETQQVVRAYWDAAHGVSLGTILDAAAQPDGGTPPDSQTLLDTGRRDIETERRILTAAFTADAKTNQPPLHSMPLLYLVTPTLRTVLDRVGALSVYHDLACRYLLAPDGSGRSCADARMQTQGTEVIDLLARIYRSDDFVARVGTASNLKTAHLPWWSLFDALRTQHATLDAALADALPPADVAAARQSPQYGTGSNGQLLDLVPADDWSPPVSQLMQLANDALGKSSAFAQTGFFDGRTQEYLSMGIQESRRASVALNLTQDIGTLNGATTTYISDRDKAAQSLLSQIQQSGSGAALKVQANIKLQQYLDLSSDLEGLRHRELIENLKLGDFSKAFADTVKRPDTDSGRQVNQHTYTLNPSALDAKFTAGSAIDSYAIGIPDPTTGSVVTSLSAGKGDILNVEASGKWGPSCAFGKPLPAPYNTLKVTQGTTGETGPEGYVVRLDGSQYTNDSNTQTHTDDDSTGSSLSLKICAGITAASGIDALGNKSQVYMTIEGCAAFDSSHRSTDSTAKSSGSGSEQQTSLDTTSGVRLPNTPFPDMPAGSLLAVEYDAATKKTRPHVIITGHNAILVAADSQVYFVVNDVGGCSSADSSALSVTVVHSQPMNNNLVMTAMGDALASMRASADDFVAQGRILSSDMTALRSSALVAMGNSIGSITQYGTSFSELYTAWADAEVNHIERVVEIERVERDRAQAAAELNMLFDEYANAQQQSVLLRAMSTLALRDVDVSTLSTPVLLVTKDLNDYLVPIIRLRYPSVMQTVNNDSSTIKALSSLLNTDWLDDPVSAAKLLVQAGTNIVGYFNSAALGTPDLHEDQIVLSFPTTDPKKVWVPSVYHKVSAARSAQVWNDLVTTKHTSFQLEPEDLIFNGVGNAELKCSSVVPIVTSMAMMFVGSSFPAADTLNNIGQSATLAMSPKLEIPTQKGFEYYTIDDGRWLPASIPVGYAQTDKVLTNFAARTSTTKVGNGLSPFTRYTFDFTSNDPTQPAWSVPPNVTEIMLVMTVQWSNVPNGLSWLPACGATN